MRLPNFLIIGAAKSGTTTLYEYLCRHPEVYMSTPKEPEFFARDENYAKGIQWYASLFAEAKSDCVCGEASTIYTRSPQFPQTAERIARHLPEVKLIYIMRHPVDRAYSHYVQRIKTAQNTRTQLEIKATFEAEIARDSLLLDSSNYIQQINNYRQFFPRESFLFLFMEDLIQKPPETLRQVCQFIGVNSVINLTQNAPIVANQAATHAEWFMRSRTTASLRQIPLVANFSALLPQSWRDLAYQGLKRLPNQKRLKKQYLPQPMLAETRQLLLAKFTPINRQLEEFLDVDLSCWSN